MRHWLIHLVVLLLITCPAFAWGNEFRIVPSLSVKEEYNSNVLFSPSSIKRDFVTTLSPGVEMVNRTERLDTDLSVRLDRLEYADNRALSATDQMYDGKFKYAATPLFNISAEGGYSRSSNPTLDVGTTGIVMATAPWNHITSSLSADYQLTEKTAAGVSYSYGRDSYDDPRYLGNTSHDVNAGLVYDLGKHFPATKGRTNVGYSSYSYPDSRIDSITGTVGFSRDLDEIWSVLVDVGVRHTWSDISVTRQVPVYDFFFGFPILLGYELHKEQVKNGGFGWVGSASLNYKGERSNGDLTCTRDITPAYGLNGAAERNYLTLSTRYRFTYELSALFSSGYYTLKSAASEFSAQVINQWTFRINPGIRYEFSKDMASEASYEYTMVDNQASHSSANRHLFSIRLNIQYPFLE